MRLLARRETMSNVLVVYYPRSGATEQIAQAIVRATGWDADPIISCSDRGGTLGVVRCAIEGRLHRLTEIEPSAADPADYDLVVIGSPVWASSMASPVRTYLTRNGAFLADVAFFLTCGGRGHDRVLDQMTKVTGKGPLSTLVLTEAQIGGREQEAEVSRFVDDLQRYLASPPDLSGSASEHRAGWSGAALPPAVR
jgi:flavodoxin